MDAQSLFQVAKFEDGTFYVAHEKSSLIAFEKRGHFLEFVSEEEILENEDIVEKIIRFYGRG